MIGIDTYTDIFIYRDLKERRKNLLENGRKSQNRKRENQLEYTRKNEKTRDVYHECEMIQRNVLSLSSLFNTVLHHHVMTVISREAHSIEMHSNTLHMSLCMILVRFEF